MTKEELFHYRSGHKPENGVRISGSQLPVMVDNPAVYYKNQTVGSDFTGNRSTRLGTVFHALCENYYKNTMIVDELLQLAEEWLEDENEPDVWSIIANVKAMYENWVENFGSKVGAKGTEVYVQYDPTDRISLNGTIDLITDDLILYDYKTTAKKKSVIGDNWMQLYFNAWVYNQSNAEPTKKVGIVYQQEPLKSGNVPDTLVVTEDIDSERMSLLIKRVQTESKLLLECLDDPSKAEIYFRQNFTSFRT